MFKLVLEKAEEPEIKLPTSTGSSKKQENFRKNFCFIDYAKAFDCVDHNILWKILQEIGISDHLTCLLRHLYAGQETHSGKATQKQRLRLEGCLYPPGTLRIASDARNGERKSLGKDSMSEPPEEANPANTLLVDFRPPEL